MNQVSLLSFAKINWVLKVLGRRPDGFHEIDSVFQTIDLADELDFETLPGNRIELSVTGRNTGALQANLVYRACRLLQSRLRSPCGMKVHLHKRIPVGGGLGGGSSNAAVTLLAANHLWKAGLGRKELAEIGAELGSDVPFFLFGGTARATGRGERLDPLPDSPRRYCLVLLFPGFQVSTREAYALGGWRRIQPDSVVLTTKPLDTKIQRFHEALAQGEDVGPLLENDFEGPVFSHYPAFAEAFTRMKKAGCDSVLLSGSGSTLFSVLGSEQKAESAAASISREAIGEVFRSHSLSRQEYTQVLMRAGLE